MGDEKLLFRALSNVLRNATRYAGGQGPITISAQRQADLIAVTVADSGPGVPDSALEKIFTPFFRLESARDRKTGGTGLGLAIARAVSRPVKDRDRRESPAAWIGGYFVVEGSMSE